MRPRPGSYGGSRIRLIAAVAAAGIAAGVGGCGGDDVAKSARSGLDKGTYVNGSSPEEYCSVLEGVKASFGPDLSADDEAALVGIHTINDIVPLAPEETKADWSGMRLIMQAVVDTDDPDAVGPMSRAEAGEIYAEISGRISDSMAEICGFPLS